jgi:hypothetical protein
MADQETSALMARIDAATRRIEAAAGAITSASPAPSNGALMALQTRHEALRAETGTALAALDTLIRQAE